MSELRRPRASVTWSYGDISTDFVRVDYRIGAHPTASFAFYSGEDASAKSSKVLNGDSAALMGRIQSDLFAGESSSCYITLTDGEEGETTLGGVVKAPTLMRGGSNYRPGAMMVGRAALMDTLRFDIYNANTEREAAAFSQGLNTLADQVLDTGVPERIRGLTDQMIEYWVNNKDSGNPNQVTTALKNNIHAANSGPLELWRSYLGNSGDIGSEWFTHIVQHRGLNHNVNRQILDMLRKPSQSFRQVVDALCREFGFLDIPDSEGQAGRMALLSDLVYGDATEMQLSAEAVVMGISSGFDTPPVQQVLLTDLPTTGVNLVRSESGLLPDGVTVLTGYPEEALNESGVVDIRPLPFFLSKVIDAISNKTINGTALPDPDNLLATFRRVDRVANRLATRIADDFATSYAKNLFADSALRPYNVTYTVPLRLDLHPGTRYRVMGANRTHLFDGLLWGVSHNLDKTARTATTMLTFTHVAYSGFELP